LPVYDKKRHEYATDLEQFHDLIRQMNEHKKTLEHKVQERTAALAEMNTELRQLGDEKEALKQVIATQVLSIDDLPKLENAQKQADEAFVRTTHAKERLKAVISEYREKVDTSMASLEQNLADYNQVIAGLAATNPRFHDFVDMKANFNKDKLLSTQDELLGVDLYETVHPLISRCQRELSDMIGETKAALQEQLDQVDKLEAVNMEKTAKLKILLEKHGRCEGLLLQQTESQQSVLAVRQREVAAMEQKVQLMQAPISAGTVEEQVARLERECAELEALRRQRLEEHDLQTKTVRGKIEQALHLMLQQEEYTQRRLAQLCDYWGNKRSTALLSINNKKQHQLLHEPNNNNNNKNGAETNDH
jgi:kinetochore protein NDC80